MCGKSELFSHLDETVRGDVNFGNKTKVPIMEKCNVLIRLMNGSLKHISDVYYVPSLHWNLLSMDQLSEKGILKSSLTMVYAHLRTRKVNLLL